MTKNKSKSQSILNQTTPDCIEKKELLNLKEVLVDYVDYLKTPGTNTITSEALLNLVLGSKHDIAYKRNFDIIEDRIRAALDANNKDNFASQEAKELVNWLFDFPTQKVQALTRKIYDSVGILESDQESIENLENLDVFEEVVEQENKKGYEEVIICAEKALDFLNLVLDEKVVDKKDFVEIKQGLKFINTMRQKINTLNLDDAYFENLLERKSINEIKNWTGKVSKYIKICEEFTTTCDNILKIIRDIKSKTLGLAFNEKEQALQFLDMLQNIFIEYENSAVSEFRALTKLIDSHIA